MRFKPLLHNSLKKAFIKRTHRSLQFLKMKILIKRMHLEQSSILIIFIILIMHNQIQLILEKVKMFFFPEVENDAKCN